MTSDPHQPAVVAATLTPTEDVADLPAIDMWAPIVPSDEIIDHVVPVSIHTSANWTRSRPSELGHPRHIDEIACQFPDQRILMSHAGYPWVLEACVIAWKHPNVYLELGAHRPKCFAAAGAGWDPLVRFGQTTIKEKVVYGSGAFLINRPYEELLGEMRSLPLEKSVLRAWLHDNAANLLSPPE